MNDQIEPYAPKPGSIPWRVIQHLQAGPSAVISKREIAREFGVENRDTIPTLLQLACARGVLIRGRDKTADLTWKLGEVPCVLATSRPLDETPAASEPEIVAAPAPAAGKWSPMTPRAQLTPPPTQAPAPVSADSDGVVMVDVETMNSLAAGLVEGLRRPAAAENEEPADASAPLAAQPDTISPAPTDEMPYSAPGTVSVLIHNHAPGANAEAVRAHLDQAILSAPHKMLSGFVRARIVQPKADKKRGTKKKPRPAAKPYLAEIHPGPLDDPANRETARYHAWLTGFGLGHSAQFRLAHMKDVEAAVGTFCAKTKARFRIAKLSQYRAGIERTA
jgi:hypothetical protein